MVLSHLQLMNQDNAIPQSYLQNKINLHAVNNRCTLFEHFCNNFIEPNKNNQKPNNQRLLGLRRKMRWRMFMKVTLVASSAFEI